MDEADLDGWIDERRALHDVAFPPRPPGRLGAAAPLRRRLAPTARRPVGARGRVRDPGQDPPPRAPPGRRRRLRRAPTTGPSTPSASTGTTRWPATPSGCPGHRTSGGRRWEPPGPCGTSRPTPPGSTAWCRDQHGAHPGPRGLGGGERDRDPGPQRPGLSRGSTGGTAPATCGPTCGRWSRPSRTGPRSAAYLHWSLVDNYEWGSYEPRFGIYGMDRARGPRGVRWMDTDAAGADSAGTYRRLIEGLRSGRREVLDRP